MTKKEEDHPHQKLLKLGGLYTRKQHRTIGHHLRGAMRALRSKEKRLALLSTDILKMLETLEDLRCELDDAWVAAVGCECRLEHSPYYYGGDGCSSCNPPEE